METGEETWKKLMLKSRKGFDECGRIGGRRKVAQSASMVDFYTCGGDARDHVGVLRDVLWNGQHRYTSRRSLGLPLSCSSVYGA